VSSNLLPGLGPGPRSECATHGAHRVVLALPHRLGRHGPGCSSFMVYTILRRSPHCKVFLARSWGLGWIRAQKCGTVRVTAGAPNLRRFPWMYAAWRDSTVSHVLCASSHDRYVLPTAQSRPSHSLYLHLICPRPWTGCPARRNWALTAIRHLHHWLVNTPFATVPCSDPQWRGRRHPVRNSYLSCNSCIDFLWSNC